MSHLLPRRSPYAVALVAALVGVLVACSTPPQEPLAPAPPSAASPTRSASPASTAPPTPSAPAPTAIAPPPASSETAGAPPAAGAPQAAAPSRDPAEAAAQARIEAAREQARQAQAQATQAAAEQCQDIATQIRADQAAERAAPSTSINEDIVAATLAKADKRIDRLQQQFDSLGCPAADRPATHPRVPQLPPAPGALPP